MKRTVEWTPREFTRPRGRPPTLWAYVFVRRINQLYYNCICMSCIRTWRYFTEQENAICSGTCECSYPTTYNGTACVRGIKHCPAGKVSVASRCLTLVPIGDSCRITQECMGFGICLGSSCSCRRGWNLVDDVCQPLNESSRCNSNEVEVNDQCYPLAEIGKRCVYNQQCLGGSRCQYNVCRCPPNTFDNGEGVCTTENPDGQNLCSLQTEEVVYEKGSSVPIDCSIRSCPRKSYCRLNPELQQYFCCRRRQDTDKGKCSNPSQSVMLKNGVAINCLYSICPPRSHCEYSSTALQYVCCG
ncbi:hypothetical protein KIN20_015258 [Parelaphostrongylus tenuis]|uniref:EB domain-containing protein n=1 Tax=Parelaphostrongylus tenuis TaxID=148309 RepID=A0AAD5N0G2_PARTN|nr:hypothetical protein KIN20_015258 [Parelaphostrongylus tenuis]